MNLDDTLYSLNCFDMMKSKLLASELKIKTVKDLLEYYPYKHVEQIKIDSLSDISPKYVGSVIIVTGVLKAIDIVTTSKKKKYLQGILLSSSQKQLQLIWFKRLDSIIKLYQSNCTYTISGELSVFKDKYTIVHPTIIKNDSPAILSFYSLTDKLKKRGINDTSLRQMYQRVFELDIDIPENIPQELCFKYKLMSRYEAFKEIHIPSSSKTLSLAKRRLKFEELFLMQYKMYKSKLSYSNSIGYVMSDVSLVKRFYEHLPFQLTNAQKRVIKEIYHDMMSGHRMNRLLQGDVGSGKTIVAFISMLVAISNGYQVAMMVPTEVLAEQHYKKISELSKQFDITTVLLTGSTTSSQRNQIAEFLCSGIINVIIGTHALLNDSLQYKKLGLVIIDEQHKFGVTQRAKLSAINGSLQPHTLIMTATPIPRTLAMTMYVEYDISTIDELPNGRKQIKTVHFYESNRLRMFGFVQQQLDLGHQIYFVYPLIDESDKINIKNLMDGYEAISRAFPGVAISIVHGAMNSKDKDFEMNRFSIGETKIMIATTVIEVGIDVPNATVMVIENADRFGLAQLHQLRGRVGRGSNESYCILMTDMKLSKQSRERINAMVKYSDGFTISNIDMKLRGAGDIMGEAQSGYVNLKIADINEDYEMMKVIKEEIKKITQY